MVTIKFAIAAAAVLGVACAGPSAVDLLGDIYNGCLKDFSVSCVRPKALQWVNAVSEGPVIKITDDLVIVKKANPENVAVRWTHSLKFNFLNELFRNNVEWPQTFSTNSKTSCNRTMSSPEFQKY